MDVIRMPNMFAKFFVMSISAFRESFTVEQTFEQSVISRVQEILQARETLKSLPMHKTKFLMLKSYR
jgi:hypothetical protein